MSTNCESVRTPVFGPATSSDGPVPIRPIGAKSRRASYFCAGFTTPVPTSSLLAPTSSV